MIEHSHPVVATLMEYAYEPTVVYLAIFGLLVASSFGLPFPEEITLLTAGLLAHIGSHPELYPPPTPDAVGVSIAGAAIVCFGSVFLSDLLVFMLGRRIGPALFRVRLFSRFFTPRLLDRISGFTNQYGSWACGIFRFTPGLRFPGHFLCGSFGIPYSRFIMIDGLAALISVPTQVVLMAYWGEEVLSILKQVKLVLAIVLIAGVVAFLWKRRRNRSYVGQPAKLEAGPSSKSGSKAV